MATTTSSGSTTATRPPAWLPLAAVGVTLVLWASAFVAIRHLADVFAPGPLSLGRLFFGSLALGLTALVTRTWRAATPRQWLAMVAIGVLWFGIYNVALNAGERRVDAGTAALLIQVSPILIAVIALVFLHERATAALGAGIVLAFAGVALIAFSTSSGTDHDTVGVLLCVLSAVVYSISLVLQKPLVATLPALQVTFVACTVGLVVCLPFAGRLFHELSRAGASDVWWLAYLGVFPTAIAFTTYAYALRHMNAGSLGVSTYLVPPITVLLSLVFLGETPPWFAYVGGVLALLGVAVTRRTPAATPLGPQKSST
ncbi:DMT family transporter [Nocardioides mangrovicus]|uniref:DMT family transporter n=1 Tax=Nocardioides mangrovicus TaxID=2478913 RepID=A0A3L8NWI3_9ACTN|nr:DMT family transporter [Nocardioides mangrovicus]RLV47606.1 DMT family transporter [Nocardioides mangrovicus]